MAELTLAERVKWILANRRRPDGSAWNPSALSEAANLGRSHVGAIARDELRHVKPSTLKAIADAAGVSVLWLEHGIGTPDNDDTARGPSTTDDETPVLSNLVGYAEALVRAKAEHPEVPARGWEPLDRAGGYSARAYADPEELVAIAKAFAKVVDPARFEAAFEAQARELERMRAELAAAKAAKAATEQAADQAPAEKPKRAKRKGGG